MSFAQIVSNSEGIACNHGIEYDGWPSPSEIPPVNAPQKAKKSGAAIRPASELDGRQSRGHRTRSRLIQSAALEFSTVGYEGASVRAIAKRARIAFQLVEYHFGSKEELWKAAVQHLFEQAVICNASLMPSRRLTPNEQLRSLLKASIVEAQRDSTFLRILTLEAMDGTERFHKILRPMCQTLYHSFSPVLAHFKEFTGEGPLSSTEARVLYNAFVFANALFEGTVGQRIRQKSDGSATVNAQVDLLASLLTHAHGNYSPGKSKSVSNGWRNSSQPVKAVRLVRADSRSDIVTASPDKLLLAAIDVFAEKGYHAASVRKIADRAGVAFQLISYHFGSKPNLWLMALVYLMDQRRSAIDASHFTTGGNHEIELEIWLRRAMYFTYDEDKLPRIMTRERFSNSQHYSKIIRPRLDAINEKVLASCREMSEMNILRRVSVDQAALLIGALSGASASQPYALELATGWSISNPKTADFLVSLLARLLSGGVLGSREDAADIGRRNKKGRHT